ncbi:hypothetical protein PI124_g14957 [Phytophthora idaei]|nr:hypothetical protein PI125_g12577 [Phytophthora idaei]KAG3240137.1 hypothetical protein PI124_g14957 [Phytophthora idaei]
MGSKELVNTGDVTYESPLEQRVSDAIIEVFRRNIITELLASPRELDRAAPAKANDELGNLTEDSSPFAWSLVPHGLTINGNDLVGKGAFGCVEEGMWLGAAVAVKKLEIKGPGEVQVFFEEANICKGQLDTYLKKEPHYSQVWGLLYDAALGLQWLHFRGIIHADLKCNNIVVTASGRAKLIDFGLSRVRTCRGFRSGDALPWKAPECLIRGSESSFASDVYSFGMCVVEAVSGDFPWGKTRVGSYYVKQGQLPQRPDSFSMIQWELVKRKCCFKPEERLQLADAVKVLGFFAQHSQYVNDQGIQEMLAKWEGDPLAEMNHQHPIPSTA